MSNDELNDLLENEQRLTKMLTEANEQLAQIRKRREALELEARQKSLYGKTVEIDVLTYSPQKQTVSFKNTYRDDFISYLRTIPSRQYNGMANFVNRSDFLTLVGETYNAKEGEQFFNFTFKYPTEDFLHNLIVQEKVPDYHIKLIKNQIAVEIANDAPANALHGIPGARWNYDEKIYKVPLTEGWRLWENLNNYNQREGVTKLLIKWDDDALTECIKQAEKRNKLIEIQTWKDYEFDAGFANGHKLRPFQKVGVAFAEAANGRWICGDEMGLGKTWQALAYAWANKFKTMICCPANLKQNWLREIFKLTGQMPVVLSGREPSPMDLVKMLLGKHQGDYFFIINYDILSSRMEWKDKSVADDGHDVIEQKEIWPWVEAILKMDFDFIAFDEAHYLKNIDSLRSQAGRKLTDIPHVMLATGTPVVNRVDELWPLLHIIDPATFSSQGVFVNQYSRDGKYARNIQELRDILKYIMIRRLKKDVVSDLPDLNTIVKYVELSPKARKIYKKALAGVYEVMADWDPSQAGSEKSIPSLLAQIIRLKQIAAIDKASFTADLATELYDEADESEINKKVIIFSQFRAVAKAIHKRLGAESVLYTGDTSELKVEDRTKVEDQFQNDDKIHFMCATIGITQEGLNLTKASHVIFADLAWTPKSHQQAIGRAYGRLSNLHGADAYYIIADDTIENWVWELLGDKMALIGQVVDGREITGEESVAGDLLRKMKAEMFSSRKKD